MTPHDGTHSGCVCKVGLFLERAQTLPLGTLYPTSPPPAGAGAGHSPGIQERALMCKACECSYFNCKGTDVIDFTLCDSPFTYKDQQKFSGKLLATTAKMRFCN